MPTTANKISNAEGDDFFLTMLVKKRLSNDILVSKMQSQPLRTNNEDLCLTTQLIRVRKANDLLVSQMQLWPTTDNNNNVDDGETPQSRDSLTTQLNKESKIHSMLVSELNCETSGAYPSNAVAALTTQLSTERDTNEWMMMLSTTLQPKPMPTTANNSKAMISDKEEAIARSLLDARKSNDWLVKNLELEKTKCRNKVGFW